MIRILHTADNHLRDSQFGRRSRGDDFARAFENVIEVAIREQIQTILVAGDLLESTRPSSKIISSLKAMDARARTTGILILVTSGNHDLTDPHWASVVGVGNDVASDPVGIKIIDNQLVKLPCGLTIYGQPYVNRDKFLELKPTLPPADILMFHGMVAELMHFKHDAALTLADLPTDKYRCIALGDIHRRNYKVVGASCLVGYPGSTELCEASEPDEKTVTVLSFHEQHGLDLNPKFLPIATRPILRYRLMTEDDVEAALVQAEMQKDKEPIVIFEFHVGLQNVPQRFAARLDPTKVILRPYPMFRDMKLMNMGLDQRASLQIGDFLEKFIPPGSSLHQVATALLAPDAGPARVHELLDGYIETRRKEIEAVTV